MSPIWRPAQQVIRAEGKSCRFVVAENTPKIRMACCCPAHAHIPDVGDAAEDVR